MHRKDIESILRKLTLTPKASSMNCWSPAIVVDKLFLSYLNLSIEPLIRSMTPSRRL